MIRDEKIDEIDIDERTGVLFPEKFRDKFRYTALAGADIGADENVMDTDLLNNLIWA